MHIHGRGVCAVLLFKSQYGHNEVALYGDSSGPQPSVLTSADWTQPHSSRATSVRKAPCTLVLLFLAIFFVCGMSCAVDTCDISVSVQKPGWIL